MTAKNILAILAPGDKMPYELLRTENVDISYAYFKGNSSIMRFLRRLALEMGLGNILLRVSLRNIRINDYDLILITENFYPIKIIKYIRKYNNNAKIYYWLWNTLFSRSRRLYNGRKQWGILSKNRERFDFKIVSFDKGDCVKYNLTYNGQVVPFRSQIRSSEEKRRIFFCGMDKGRLTCLRKLAKVLSSHSISYLFWVLPERNGIYSKEDWEKYLHKDFLDYNLLLRYEMESCCILDIVQKGQKGLTWRPIEALFYQKKLITNFADIIKYNFYSPDNIFILGKDNIDDLPEFLTEPYRKIDWGIIKKYTFKYWIKRL
ncbi:hypothetical protein [uncultured Dialister sp.]|uniref:hypothetical protein n=1 Tax=uncultured Dialister sp. TaxID=278064 RepID=UPI00259A5642|nr:hypothetical protein [uncultured Dialister sp.]